MSDLARVCHLTSCRLPPVRPNREEITAAVTTVHRVLDPGRQPLLIAHRVGNSPSAIPAAVAAGADLIEADVHLYRRRLEVRHTKTMGVLPWLWDRWYLVPAATERLVLAALVGGL